MRPCRQCRASKGDSAWRAVSTERTIVEITLDHLADKDDPERPWRPASPDNASSTHLEFNRSRKDRGRGAERSDHARRKRSERRASWRQHHEKERLWLVLSQELPRRWSARRGPWRRLHLWRVHRALPVDSGARAAPPRQHEAPL